MLRKTLVIATPDTAQRARLGRMVDQMSEFEVIAQTGDLMNTYNVVEERQPKAVLIADVLANLPEFEVMRALFSTLDIRWLVVTMPDRSTRLPQAPVGDDSPGSDLFSIPANAPEEIYVRQLCALTRTAQNLNPAKKPRSGPSAQIGDRRPTTKAIAANSTAERPKLRPAPQSHRLHQPILSRNSASVTPGPATPPMAGRRRPEPGVVVPAGQVAIPETSNDRVILIGASTGGVDALLAILSRFPENCPPTLVVQHTGTGFGESLAGLLDRQCLPTVHLATGPQPIRRGQILIGAGTRTHLVMDGRAGTRAVCQADAPVSGHIPSVDMLFSSAVPLASRVSAALLTGMGRDGANGMKALYDGGAFTIAQNEASCVVYGMPRAAVQSGCVHKILPLDRIAEALLAGRGDAPRTSRELQR
ncbi:CheB methylesterase domain-containing protein [Antarctobacter heliothermus]|uniref:protein-glutamate methylesterase n=1 Tax=Antarctobacter heliothermus TaxID=74033 RepID=A0A239HQ00_9RHOB|nr:CheB methylesterase domain-containing protein [Antarctobacter heliothermus]SNS83225.1 CheB methylesterase [Antarctobacter heliothermus]